jgi:hypothetical protein|tara:strand:- start:974 stop:1312 length:339 start_codon:yes stop_codon:yes gene_type:complete
MRQILSVVVAKTYEIQLGYIVKRRKFILAVSALPAAFLPVSAVAGCLQYQTSTVRCGTCGGDGREDSGSRIGLPRSEWKNKHTCRACGGSGTIQKRRCVSYDRPKSSGGYQK